MLRSLPPRSFADLTVPNRADGTPMTSCRGEDDYKTYVHWLADYLHTTDIPLTPAQQAWLQTTAYTPDQAVFWCSDTYGYAIDQVDGVELAFAEEETWEHYRERMRPFWVADEEDKEENPFDEWIGIDEPTFNRLHAEWLESQACGDIPRPADVPFRPLLAWALRQIPDRAERVRKLDGFFRNFSDNASK